VLDDLLAHKLAYRCACSRARLATLGHVYDGYCRQHPPATGEPCAIRLQLPDQMVLFGDRVLGAQQQQLTTGGDCIIHRKDGFYAYQLAVVVDDMDQGITDVVRGSDILEATGAQVYLTELLGGRSLRYAHLPLVLGSDGQKLSKQNHAPALDNTRPSENLWQTLVALRQDPPSGLAAETPETILAWAIAHWDITNLIPRHILKS
jgi:glutamyl-Q tRNA(Asp) synthetase